MNQSINSSVSRQMSQSSTQSVSR